MALFRLRYQREKHGGFIAECLTAMSHTRANHILFITADFGKIGCGHTISQPTHTTSKPYECRPPLSPRVPPRITGRALVPHSVEYMHDHRDCAGPLRPRFPGSCRRIASLHLRAFYGAKLHPIQPFVQNGAKTNQMNLGIIKRDSIIGRDPIITYAISSRIVRREIKRRQREAKWMRIVSKLKFWSK